MSAMPAPVGEVFLPLKGELVFTRAGWNQFRQVFGTDSGRIDLLNRIAPEFFGFVQEALYDDVLLALFRLQENEQTGKKDNCTFARLLSAVSADRPALGAQLQPLLDTVKRVLQPFDDWRNKR